MLIVVAERFKWPPSEIKIFELEELVFWYRSAAALYENEEKAAKKRK
jgi:hypothetical protein